MNAGDDETLEQNLAKPETIAVSTPAEAHTSVPENSLRVNVGLLDSLMTLAGEPVLGRNQRLQPLSRKDLKRKKGLCKPQGISALPVLHYSWLTPIIGPF